MYKSLNEITLVLFQALFLLKFLTYHSPITLYQTKVRFSIYFYFFSHFFTIFSLKCLTFFYFQIIIKAPIRKCSNWSQYHTSQPLFILLREWSSGGHSYFFCIKKVIGITFNQIHLKILFYKFQKHIQVHILLVILLPGIHTLHKL